MKRPRLWVVSELYYPEQTSTGYFLTRIAEGLADDFEVHVVCGQPSYSERGIRAPRRETRAGTTIYRLAATHFAKDRLLLRAVNILTLSLSAFWFGLLRFRRGDQLLIVTNPPTLPPLLGLAARFHGMRSSLLVHDVYPEVLAATGFLGTDSLAYRLLGKVFDGTYRLFDRVIVLGRDMREVVARKVKDADRIAIIPNWGDVDEITPLPRAQNRFALAHDLVGKYVIQFSGNIGRTHDIEMVLEAARALQGDDRFVFLFVGYGGKTGHVSDALAELGNVRFLPRQPREMLGPMLACSDMTVIAFVDGMFGLSVPSRMYNVLSAGTPIAAIADLRSELSLMVAENQAGWVFAPGDVTGLVDCIRALGTPEGRADAETRGARGRAAIEAEYSFPKILEGFRALLNRP